jgi:hypothetical protein
MTNSERISIAPTAELILAQPRSAIRVFREQQSSPGFRCASSGLLAIQCRFVNRFAGSIVPSRVSCHWFSARGASLPSCGVPVSPVPPLSAVLRRHYDFPFTHQRSLMGPLPLPTGYLRVRARHSAPARSEASSGPGRLVVRPPQLPASSYVDANGISQVFRRSFPCLCSVPRPRSNRRALAITVTSMLPPLCAQ